MEPDASKRCSSCRPGQSRRSVVEHAPLATQSQTTDAARCFGKATIELMLICGDSYGDIATVTVSES